MKKYFLFLIIIPLIYVASYGRYCSKNGEKAAAAGTYITVAISLILGMLMFFIG